jgi:lipoate-protein ligase A
MKLLDLTLDTPAEDLALDEALLDDAEQTDTSSDTEVLRLWEPQQIFVVAGSSSRLAEEVNLDACNARGIPILRRTSGGATIVTGPGCLMYSVVLAYRDRSHLRDIGEAHQFVLGTIAKALRPSAPDIRQAGISDLALGEPPLKFSGNSLRCKRDHFLYHGTILYNFSIDEITALLKMPSRQPAYRQARSHHDFLTNLPLERAAVRQALIDAFSAHQPRAQWPRELTAKLATEKYSRPEWNERL